LARRLDRLVRQTERLERDVGIAVETLALFVRFWLTATPALPEQAQAAARAKGAERYHAFIEALGRRLAKGPTLLREVSLDVAAAGELDASFYASALRPVVRCCTQPRLALSNHPRRWAA